MPAEVILCHVLSSLIQAIQSRRVVDSSASPGPSRQAGAISATNPNLAQHDGLVPALSVPLNIVWRAVDSDKEIRELEEHFRVNLCLIRPLTLQRVQSAFVASIDSRTSSPHHNPCRQ
jgi:hypothetical protein